ncbi:AAA family ATPase [Vibrio sp.]|nr:AAA family ATPase [Vibrio sp.]
MSAYLTSNEHVNIINEHALDLPSQKDLLERLALLTRYQSQMLSVSGEAGSGRSWLSQRYLEAYAQDKEQALLLCHPQQSDAQRRAILFSQCFSFLYGSMDKIDIQPELSIIAHFDAFFDECPCNMVLVIDDAHLLSDTLLLELWELVFASQVKPGWQIHVVLFGEEHQALPLLPRYAGHQSTAMPTDCEKVEYQEAPLLQPIVLAIPNLSSLESQAFFDYLILRYTDVEREAWLKKACKRLPCLPGGIMALNDKQPKTKKIIIRSIITSPARMAMTFGGATLTGIVAYLSIDLTPIPTGTVAKPIELAVIKETVDGVNRINTNTLTFHSGDRDGTPPLEWSVESSSESNNDRSQTLLMSQQDVLAKPGEIIKKPQEVRSFGYEDDAPLPQEVVGSTLSVGKEDSSQRVVISSDVVDALLSGGNQGEITLSAIHQTAPLLNTDSSNVGSSPLPTIGIDVATQAPPLRINLTYDRKELASLAPSDYTVQLAALETERDLGQFIDGYELEGQVRVYKAQRNGQDWYIVTYGQFNDIQSARDEIYRLPEGLQTLSPWAKSLSNIQKEL